MPEILVNDWIETLGKDPQKKRQRTTFKSEIMFLLDNEQSMNDRKHLVWTDIEISLKNSIQNNLSETDKDKLLITFINNRRKQIRQLLSSPSSLKKLERVSHNDSKRTITYYQREQIDYGKPKQSILRPISF